MGIKKCVDNAQGVVERNDPLTPPLQIYEVRRQRLLRDGCDGGSEEDLTINCINRNGLFTTQTSAAPSTPERNAMNTTEIEINEQITEGSNTS